MDSDNNSMLSDELPSYEYDELPSFDENLVSIEEPPSFDDSLEDSEDLNNNTSQVFPNTSQVNNYLDGISEFEQEITFDFENNTQVNNITINEVNSSEDQTTDYNNEIENNYIVYDTSPTSTNVVNDNNSQYQMLFDTDVNNPFFKCNIDNLDYDTDNEDDNSYLRVIYFWNYEFNYDYFKLRNINIFNSKDDIFKNNLNELKNIRSNKLQNVTGEIVKLENDKFKKNDICYIYLIVYYDNAKANIIFYGLFNQEICEKKLLENIKTENVYGKEGVISESLSNLGNYDFIVIKKKLPII